MQKIVIITNFDLWVDADCQEYLQDSKYKIK